MPEMQIGKTIHRARKALGITQEQLGASLGVSAGAVSKWETGSALPDIALLQPLARALNLSLDALLGYERELSIEEYAALCKKIDDTFIHQGADTGREQLYRALHTYPNNGGLKILGAKNIRMHITKPEDEAAALEEALTLYGQAQTVEGGRFKQAALFGKAEIYLTQGRHAESQACLAELAEGSGFDPMLLYPRLLIEQGKWEQATGACKGQLLQYLNAALAMLGQLAHIANQQGDTQAECLYLEKQCLLEDAFGVGLCMGTMMLARHYLRHGQLQEAAVQYLKYVKGVIAYPLSYNGHPVFDGVQLQADEAAQHVMRQTLLRELAKNDAYVPLAGQPAYGQAQELIHTFANSPGL